MLRWFVNLSSQARRHSQIETWEVNKASKLVINMWHFGIDPGRHLPPEQHLVALSWEHRRISTDMAAGTISGRSTWAILDDHQRHHVPFRVVGPTLSHCQSEEVQSARPTNSVPDEQPKTTERKARKCCSKIDQISSLMLLLITTCFSSSTVY